MAARAEERGRGVGLRLEGVRQVYEPAQVVIENLDLRVEAGEFLAILGPSGCGKSTLLRLIAGLAAPTEGRVGRDEGGISYVFQDAHLLPWRTVADNVALPLELLGVERGERRRRAAEILGRVGLGGTEERYPAQLSGGMRMRVSLCRALVTEPRLLLLDEPFAALDEITRFRLDVQLRESWSARGLTVVFVTHSTSEAAFLADRAVVLSRRMGRIKLDRHLELPRERSEEFRTDPRLAAEMRVLLAAMEEEEAVR